MAARIGKLLGLSFDTPGAPNRRVRSGPSREPRMCHLALILIGWTVGSLPLAILVGKIIAAPRDEEMCRS